MSTWQLKLQEAAAKHITHNVRHFGFTRNFAMGIGMGWAIQQEKYWHLPIAFWFASPYAGYQLFKHRDSAVSWIQRHYTSSATTSAGTPSAAASSIGAC